MSIERILQQQLGLELPEDGEKEYWPPFEEGPEYGLADLPAGGDLFGALKVVFGARVEDAQALRAASLAYYVTTRMYVGPGEGLDPLADEVEWELRRELPPHATLQDAVAFICARLDIPHPSSVEYVMMSHPRIIGVDTCGRDEEEWRMTLRLERQRDGMLRRKEEREREEEARLSRLWAL